MLKNENIIIKIVFLAVCFMSAYGAAGTYSAKQYTDKQFDRINEVQEVLTEQIAKGGSAEDMDRLLAAVKITVDDMRDNKEDIQSLSKDFNFMLKDYSKLRFPEGTPEGLYTEYGLFDVIEEDNKGN